MPDTNVATLGRPKIDTSIVADASANLENATKRLQAAESAVVEKQAAATAADEALSASIRAVAEGRPSNLTPSDAHGAVRAALEDLSIAERIRDAAQDAANAAAGARHASDGIAYRPLLQYGARERVAATQDYQAGLKVLRDAKARSEAADRLISEAVQHGCKLGFDGAMLCPVLAHHLGEVPEEVRLSLKTPEQERETWEGVI